MPYIEKEKRKHLKIWYESTPAPRSAGELNFVFTQVIQDYLEANKESYQTYNDIMGALEGTKLELYRRKIAPYEDKKIKENGDVY